MNIFFNLDPLTEKYYYNSSYSFSENKVVAHVELEGLEAVEAKTVYVDNPNGTITATTNTTVTNEKLQGTLAITSGTDTVDAKVAGLDVAATVKTHETDLVGFRDNGFVFGGYNQSGNYVERSGLSGGGGLVSLGFEGTRVDGLGTSEDVSFSFGNLKTTVTTDAATCAQSAQQSFDIVGISLGIGVVGFEFGISYKQEETSTQTTTIYKGNMGMKVSGGNKSPTRSASKVTWTNTNVSQEEVDKIKELIK